MPIGSGTRIGPYEVVALVGSGGMGEVYRARAPRLRRDVAIKVIGARFATDPDLLNRFQQEALTIAALNHPNIVAVHGAQAVTITLVPGIWSEPTLSHGPRWGAWIEPGLMSAAHVDRELRPPANR